MNILTPMPGTETWRDAVKNGAVPETDFDWSRLGVFASYKHSNAATLADWLGKRRTNNSVYMNERYLSQEGLFKIMSEFDDKIRVLATPPSAQVPGDPFPLMFPESALAHKYCRGRGLEIGGSAHNPFGLNALNVDMTDSPETVFKREEIRLCGRSLPVDIVAGGDAIPRPDESQDFVVSSHVLEHFPNPIKALQEWDRLLRPSGVIFMIVPHKDRTFDREKARTPLQHLIDDYVKGNTEPHGDPNGHDHCWITEDVVELVRWMIDNLGVQWEIIEVQDKDDKVGNGFTIVVRKKGSGIDALLSRFMGSVRCSQEALRDVAESARAANVPVPVVERAIRGLFAERLSSKAALELGELCFDVKLYESAAAFFEQALRGDPGNAEAMNDLGVLCHRLNEMELAREFFARALAIAPESSEAFSNLARLPAQT